MDIVAKALGWIGVAVIVSFLLSYPLMLLWNLCLVPAVPGINTVGWGQMWGISLLIGSMVKSTG